MFSYLYLFHFQCASERLKKRMCIGCTSSKKREIYKSHENDYPHNI